MVDYNIISSGSKGNAVILDNYLLIDAGVPYKALAAVLRDLRLVLLTHIHGDHFNKATIRNLARNRPTLRFGCCEWLVPALVGCEVDKRSIDVYRAGNIYNYGSFTISPFRLIHNVPNCGYKIHFAGRGSVLYATDTNSMQHVKAEGYDLYMLEANYNQTDIVRRIKGKQAQGLFCHEHDVLKNHLSEEKAIDWIYANVGSNSRYIFLHQHEDVKCRT